MPKNIPRRIARSREIPFDHLTPVAAYKAVATQGSCLLESSPGTPDSRYTYIGTDPIATFKARGQQIEIEADGGKKEFSEDPYEALRKFREEFATKFDHPLAAYCGGIIGFVSYDAIRVKEKIPSRHLAPFDLPDFFFQSYRSNIVFDHEANRALLVVIAQSEEESENALNELQEKIHQAKPLPLLPKQEISEARPDLSDDEFKKLVERAKQHLLAGDVFQIVLSRTFQKKVGDPFLVYRSLRQMAPAPYLFFFDLDGYSIAGASPEKLISVKDGVIESTPIAGTRPAGSSASELMADPKEMAEHVMLVDLARNDLGAVSIPGTVEVTQFMKVRSFSHVMHIVSKVTGKLDPKLDALDAFKISFPAGTLTGAPKIRAMELIDALEVSRRGLYGGAIVALDSEGNLTSCIAIRTALIREGIAFVRAGCGIVLDSVPESEALETMYKANTVLESL